MSGPGTGFGAKEHEADRWVAAGAKAGELPLASDDSIFDGVSMLHRLDPDVTYPSLGEPPSSGGHRVVAAIG